MFSILKQNGEKRKVKYIIVTIMIQMCLVSVFFGECSLTNCS